MQQEDSEKLASSSIEDDFLSILEKLPKRLHDGDLELVATVAIEEDCILLAASEKCKRFSGGIAEKSS